MRMAPPQRRAQLIDAATAMIAATGFQGFSLAALARECDLTRPGVLHHFASAEDLLVAVLRKRDEQDLLALVPAQWPTNAEQARYVLHRLVARNATQRELIRLYTVLCAEALAPDHPAHEYFLDHQKGSHERLRYCLRWHPRGHDLAVEVLAVFDGLQLAWLRNPTLDLVALWDDYADRAITSA